MSRGSSTAKRIKPEWFAPHSHRAGTDRTNPSHKDAATNMRADSVPYLRQTTFQGFTGNEPARLLQAPHVAAILGVETEAVFAMVESGELEWAFNIGLGSKLERRIVAECVKPGGKRFADLEDVVDHLVTDRFESVRATLLAARFSCSRMQIHWLHNANEITGHVNGHKLYINCESLREFLRRRRIL